MAQGLSQGFFVPKDMRLSVEDPEAFSAWAIRNEAWTRGELQRMDTIAPLDLPDFLVSFWAYLDKTRVPPETVTCTKGCSACCHVHVAALIPEVVYLSRAVACEAPAVRREIIGQIQAGAARIQGTTLARRVQLRVPCALLNKEEGTCAAYALRPATCRGENSIEDPRLCAEPRGRHDRMAELFLQFTSARYGAAERLAARGLDARFVELTLGLALTLEDESAIPRWAQGDHTAFESVSLPYPYHEGPGGSTARRAGLRLPLFPDGSRR